MITKKGDSFSEIYYELLMHALNSNCDISNSRVGPVKDLGPAYIEISNADTFRIPLLEKRAFNPFFVLSEFSWIIHGSNKLDPLRYFIKDFGKYSDNGLNLNGAYGYRLRYQNGYDQIERAIEILRSDKNSRRVVLSMWDSNDLGSSSKDIPCNVSIMLKIRNNSLDMTVINRSNDLYYGIPYNIVVFYLLQCYFAKKLEVNIGVQRHYTDSLHLYVSQIDKVKSIVANNNVNDINSVISRFESFDLSDYIMENHEKILERNYMILNSPYKEFFCSFQSNNQKFSIKDSIDLLPKNILGYSGFMWFKEKKNYETSNHYFEQDFKDTSVSLYSDE